MASSGEGSAHPHSVELEGPTQAFGRLRLLLIAAFVVLGLALRLAHLGAEGFADDEVHKWLAADRYLALDFGGDDLEHPMLMKSLVAVAILAGGGRLSPETATRLPSALAGGLTALAVALLGRRLFGRDAGVLAAGLVALASTAVGYHRIGKEDALLGLFFTLCVWAVCEARAAAQDGRTRAQGRWELAGAAWLGAAFASKYFIFYFLIPVVSYLWLRPSGRWRVPLRRWAVLVALALVVFLVLNATPLAPSTYEYLGRYIRGDHVGGDRGVSESLLFMGVTYGNMGLRGGHTPWWFFLAFAAFKFTPLVALSEAAGIAAAIAWRRPGHRVLLVWITVFLLFSLIAGGKYGRFFVSAMPAFLLLAAHAAVEGARWVGRRMGSRGPAWIGPALTGAVGLALVLPEAAGALGHAPHERLYVSPLVGGDRAVTWFLPHCDYFDAGVREALAWVAAHAEPDAEVASEVDWTIRFYAAQDGRPDLVSSPILPGEGCRTGKPCYVLVQPGRRYWHAARALARLDAMQPVHVERIRSEDAVRVYRLPPGAPLFPPADVAKP